ncbi:hypothetical protein CVT24_007709 [Panaeolus cyanescens]|uniref:Uncharacterized protein n=1 Tax=Panaeolus cyanescens TaxID=181874 RepID=A0A409YWW1_9AGAR|nr:hypothetical protein CVT24_007709 [Panaeolus cyanescens]
MSTDSLSTYFESEVKHSDSKEKSQDKLSRTVSKDSKLSSSSESTIESPYNFVIGKTTLSQPLVDFPLIEGHLALLHAFSELKETVQKLAFFDEFTGWNDDTKWRYFVGLAVERFDIWCEKLNEEDIRTSWDIFLPPVDVLMVWHTYLLNPLWYREDAQRVPRCRILAQLGYHLISALESERLPSLLKYEASAERKSFWTTRTSLDFDHRECLTSYRKKGMKNVCCGQVDEIEFCNKGGYGYLQRAFFNYCSERFTHNQTVISAGNHSYPTMSRRYNSIYKLALDLLKSTSSPEGYLAGSYLAVSESSRSSTREEGLRIKSLLLSDIEANPKVNAIDGTDRYLWEVSRCYKMSDLKRIMGDSALTRRILSAYSDDRVYSVELVDAVVRQGKFVDKMKELKWSAPNFLDKSDARILQHAVARYHAFLDLLATHPGTMLVPTLDIDLVWHTHQLTHSRYWNDCVHYVGRFIDHNDKVEGPHLSNAFDQTGFLWRNRFKVPYTFCGCPTPTPNIGQRLSTLITRADKRVSSPTYSYTITPPVQKSEATLATHPSDHNAVTRYELPKLGQPIDSNTPCHILQRKKAKELNHLKEKLNESAAYHQEPFWRDHPYAVTFVMVAPLFLTDSGMDGGNQCVAGYSDTSVQPPA